MPNPKLADIEFTLEWKSPYAEHTDSYYVTKVNPSIDKLPDGLAEKIIALKVGKSCSHTYPAKNVIDESYSSNNVIPFNSDVFDTQFKDQFSPPILYRFYPSAIAWQGLETEHTDYSPFRLISMNGDNFVADKNHPLSKYYLTLTARKLAEFDLPKDVEKRTRNIGKLISSKGPGMQAPFEFGESVLFDPYPFVKQDPQESVKPRLEPNSVEHIAKHYSQLLPKLSKVLDLLSSEFSYLEDDYKTGFLAGIGPNEESLNSNERLDTYQIQDLNEDDILPFDTNSFDNAICTQSIETLIDPLAIMKEVARVVSSGGKFIITFSGSAPAPNAISVWGQLHPFERIQLVLEYFSKSGAFTELNTLSKRGALRSSDNNPVKKTLSEPIFSIWGIVK